MANVFCASIHQPPDTLLVVLMALAFNDDRLEMADELFSALGREVLLAEGCFTRAATCSFTLSVCSCGTCPTSWSYNARVSVGLSVT